MNIDPARLQEDLRRAGGGLAPSPELLDEVRRRGRRRLRRHRLGGALAVAASVAAVALGVPEALTWVRERPGVPAAAGKGAQVALPDRFAGYSYLTGSVSASPPGPAVALFQHGVGVEFLDFPQAVVVGADDDYRRVDLAEDRGTGGDPAPMLLSPDGTRIAVGDHDDAEADLALLDLTTGEVKRYPVPGARSVVPAAWSRDGRLAYLAGSAATSPHGGTPVIGDVGLLDADTGETQALPGAGRAQVVAFAPDGDELAVQRAAAEGNGLEVVGLDGQPRRRLTAPRGHHLDGPEAWSPDGQLVATSRAPYTCFDLPDQAQSEACEQAYAAVPDAVSFLDASGRGLDVPEPLDRVAEEQTVLGWAAPDALLVLAGTRDPEETGGSELWVTRVPLDGGDPQRLSRASGGGNFAVLGFHLATALLGDPQVRPAGEPDRGPWPLWVQVPAVLAAGCAALVGVRSWRSRHPGLR